MNKKHKNGFTPHLSWIASQDESAKARFVSRKSAGFTLIELILYTAVFGVVSGLLTTILITSTRITTTQTVSTQVSNELNLVLDTVQRLVRDSSLIECVSNSNCTLTTGSYLKLRFQDQTLDPTCVYLSGTQILVARGPDATNSQNCTATTQALTTDKVNVDSLTFTKFDVPGGHATVQIDATLTYNSTNPDLQLSRTLRSAIGRVSAATFDSDLTPDLTNSRSIGSTIGSRVWKNIFLSGVLGLGTATDAQETGFTTVPGALYYNTTRNILRAYNGATSTWNDVGGSQWTTSGSNIYYNTGNVGVGTDGGPTSLLHLIGSQPASVATAGTAATQALQVTGGKGGNTTGTTGQLAGIGATVNITGGAGGSVFQGTHGTGTHGGGNGSTYGTAGTENTGGGGGGGSGGSTASGGSGIVIIRYPDTYKVAVTTGSPVITVISGYRIYKFTASGTITF